MDACLVTSCIVAVVVGLFVSAQAAIALSAGGILVWIFGQVASSSSSSSSSSCGVRSGRRAKRIGNSVEKEDDCLLPPPDATREYVYRPKEELKTLLCKELQEHPLDERLSEEKMRRGKEGDMRALYTTHMPRLLDSISKENTTQDPNIRPVGRTQGSRRSLGVI